MEKLKDMYSVEFLTEFAHQVKSVEPTFLVEPFVTTILEEDWEILSVRSRAKKIATVLGQYLSADYTEAITVLLDVVKGLNGFAYLFLPDFVAIYGRKSEDWELSMSALERFTQSSSAEFAIRPFLVEDEARTMNRMLAWTQHENEHIRRLASEGCRPRLPWGEHLTVYRQDPTPVLYLLENLKADDSLYVRKSVANNLNDISKDHPEAVLALAKKWLGENEKTDWIIRRACRTLIKEDDPKAMALFGYQLDPESISAARIEASPSKITLGESSELTYTVDINQVIPTAIRLEYAIDFIKANGKSSRKKFFISESKAVRSTTFTGTKKHLFKELSTRKHYAGVHHIFLLVNGLEVAQTMVELSTSEET